MGTPLSHAHQAVLDRFPLRLKALVLAELEAGNFIIEAGAGHPAPPAGDMIKLGHDLITRANDAADDLHCQERYSSTHHQEISDEERFFWILTAPLPPPSEPDMNTIREHANFSQQAGPIVERSFPPGTVEMDVRGEMLILHEANRRTDIIWTWNRGNQLYRSSLSPWWYPTERRSEPMNEEEKERVIDRFMAYARANISSNIELRD